MRDSGIHGFWVAIWTFCVIATLQVIQVMADLYLAQRFFIRWRVWLTNRLTADWLNGRAYYRGRFIDPPIDNPDQRIQQDIDIFTAGVGGATNSPSVGTSATLLFGAIRSVVSVVSFAAILWRLSGTLVVFGIGIPKALFWVLFVYVLAATVIAFWIGHPLITFSFRNELFNAAFRYALVRLRDAAEAVGFYRGEPVERAQLRYRFAETIANYRRYVHRTIGFLGWNVTMSQTINPLPFIVQAPRLFAGSIKLGGVIQSAGAFGQIEESLSFFRNAYDRFASYRAAIIRLNGLVGGERKSTEAAGAVHRCQHRRFGRAGRRRGPHPDREATDRAAQFAARARRRPGHHREVGLRQNHAAAQPRSAVAVLLGQAAAARRPQRRHVPPAAVLPSAG